MAVGLREVLDRGTGHEEVLHDPIVDGHYLFGPGSLVIVPVITGELLAMKLLNGRIEQHGDEFVAYEPYPESERPRVGKLWANKELNSGCGGLTTMGKSIAETYARDPRFYGSTFCCNCGGHFRVEEFVWDGTHERVGT